MSWSKVKLGEVSVSIQPGPFGSQLHSSDYSDVGTPIVMPKDMIDGRIVHGNLERVPEEHVKRLSRHQVCEGNLMVARKGDVRKCVYITEKERGWLTGSDCLKVSLNEKRCFPKFIYYQLRSPFIGRWLETISIGATMPSINTGLLSSIELHLPDIATQKHIANILSAYDNLIENNQKQIKLLEEAAQRLYKEWFIDLRFPGHETVKIVDGIPTGWQEKFISELCLKMNAGGTPSRGKKSFYALEGHRWFKTKELLDNWLIDSEEHISDEGLAGSSAKLFPPNTIVMAIYASPTLGRLGIMRHESTTNQAALCMAADSSKCSWQWLFHKLYELRDEFNAIARGAGQQNISGDAVKSKVVVVPTKKLMDLFTKNVEPIFEKMYVLTDEIEKLKQTRDRLLPKLMSSEIEV